MSSTCMHELDKKLIQSFSICQETYLFLCHWNSLLLPQFCCSTEASYCNFYLIWGCHGTRNNSEVTMIPAVLETAKQTLWSSFWLPDHRLLSYNMVCRIEVLLEGITNLVGIALSLWHHLAANTCFVLVLGFFFTSKNTFPIQLALN